MLLRKKFYVFGLLLAGLLLSLQTYAQPLSSVETEQVKNAEKLFLSKNYEKAFPIFSQILSNHPENPYYNYCLGVCLLKTGSDKSESIRFLLNAATSAQSPVDAWLYLGQAYHAAAKYEDAIAALENYKLNVNKNVWAVSNGDKIISMCRNGINSKNDFSFQQHRIVEKFESTREDFVKLYQNIGGNGRFLRLPKDYEEKSTKGNYESTFLFLAINSNTMVFSNKGKTKEKGFEIYKVNKDANGLWMFPQPLNEIINTLNDEAYPVIVNEGNTIYFSSNGIESIGGYDIYKSDFDYVSQKWSTPQSMGTHVNSPGDDFFYVPSPDNKTAYFSSNRESSQGKCIVYKAAITEIDKNFILVDGMFNCNSGLDLSDASITIMNSTDSSLMTQFKVPANKGTFKLRIPSNGKVIYRVELAGFNPAVEIVDFSKINKTTVRQDVSISRNPEGKEKLKISFRDTSFETSMTAMNDENVIHPTEIRNQIEKPYTVTQVHDKNLISENVPAPLVSIVNTKQTNNPDKSETENITNQDGITQSITATENATLVNSEKSLELPMNVDVNNNKEISSDVLSNNDSTYENINHTGTTILADKNSITENNIPVAMTDIESGNSSITNSNNEQVNSETEQKQKTEKNGIFSGLFAKKEKRIFSTEHYVRVEQPVKPAEFGSTPVENVVFRVQLGAYRTKEVENLKKKYSDFGLTDLVYVKNDQNLLLVMTGSETTYKSASELKEKMIQTGIKDAFIVVYSEGTRMPIALFETIEE